MNKTMSCFSPHFFGFLEKRMLFVDQLSSAPDESLNPQDRRNHLREQVGEPKPQNTRVEKQSTEVLNIRDDSGAVMGKLLPKTRVRLTGNTTNMSVNGTDYHFSEIENDGKKAWVATQYLSDPHSETEEKSKDLSFQYEHPLKGEIYHGRIVPVNPEEWNDANALQKAVGELEKVIALYSPDLAKEGAALLLATKRTQYAQEDMSAYQKRIQELAKGK